MDLTHLAISIYLRLPWRDGATVRKKKSITLQVEWCISPSRIVHIQAILLLVISHLVMGRVPKERIAYTTYYSYIWQRKPQDCSQEDVQCVGWNIGQSVLCFPTWWTFAFSSLHPPQLLGSSQATPSFTMDDDRFGISSASAATWWLLFSISLLLLMEREVVITIWMEELVSVMLLEGTVTSSSILLISLRFPHSTTYSPHTISPAPSKLPHEPMLQPISLTNNEVLFVFTYYMLICANHQSRIQMHMWRVTYMQKFPNRIGKVRGDPIPSKVKLLIQ